MRLICYDDLFRTKKEILKSVPTRGDWIVRAETSRVDDSKNVILYLDSIDPVMGRFGKMENMQIAMACRENTTSIWIRFGGHFMADLHGGHVTYRVDKLPAKRKSFRESNNNEALGLWNGSQAIPFIKEIMDGDTLYVSAVPFSESAVEGEFHIAGLAEAVKPLREACNW